MLKKVKVGLIVDKTDLTALNIINKAKSKLQEILGMVYLLIFWKIMKLSKADGENKKIIDTILYSRYNYGIYLHCI
jgi:hypothetical protein